MRYFIAIFLFLTIYSHRIYSYWQQFDNIYGGCIFDYVELDDDRIFAATYKNGIYESTDNGKTWHKLNFPYSKFYEDTFFSLAKTNDGDVYLASYLYGLYKYSKEGDWFEIPFEFGAINSLFIHNSKIFTLNNLGAQYYDIISGQWVFIDYFYLNEVYSIAESSKGILYASANYMGGASAIHISTDGGDSWLLELVIYDDIAQKIIFHNAKDLIIGTIKGDVYSYDTKHKSLKRIFINQNTSQILSLHTNGDSTIFVGTKYDGMFVTHNFGESWYNVELPRFNEQINNFYRLKNGTLLCATLGAGIIVSNDNGSSWHISNLGYNGLIINSIREERNGYIYLCTEGSGIYKINHEGIVYRFSNSGLASGRIRAIDIKDSLIVIGTSGGLVYRYDNESATWLDLNIPETVGDINTIQIMPDFSILAGTNKKGVLHRDNLGNWIEKNNGFDPVYGKNCLIIRRKEDLLFASISSYGIYRSDDFGDNWENISPFQQANTFNLIEFDSVGNIFVAYSFMNIYKSEDNGHKWSQNDFYPWFDFSFANCMSITAKGKILIGSRMLGYVELDTNSKQITVQNHNLHNYTIKSICLSNNGYVFIGTDGSGVYRSNEPITSVEKELLVNHPFVLRISSVEELFKFYSKTNTEIILLDLLGRVIAVVGKDEILNIATNLSSGIYFILIKPVINYHSTIIWIKN